MPAESLYSVGLRTSVKALRCCFNAYAKAEAIQSAEDKDDEGYKDTSNAT